MKKRHPFLISLSLLLISPFLIAASRTPYAPTTSDYSDMEVIATEKETDPEKSYQLYDFTIKNTGNGYIVQGGQYKCHSVYGNSFMHPDSNDEFFHSAVIAPGKEFTFTESLPKEVNVNDADFYATAYIEGDRVPFNGFSQADEHHYVIDANVSLKHDHVLYDYIIVLEYDGVEHAFVSKATNADCKVTFYTKTTDFDASKAVLKDLIEFRYEEYSPNYAGYALGGAIYMGLIFVGVLAGSFVFIILPAIIIPKAIKRSKRKKEGQ